MEISSLYTKTLSATNRTTSAKNSKPCFPHNDIMKVYYEHPLPPIATRATYEDKHLKVNIKRTHLIKREKFNTTSGLIYSLNQKQRIHKSILACNKTPEVIKVKIYRFKPPKRTSGDDYEIWYLSKLWTFWPTLPESLPTPAIERSSNERNPNSWNYLYFSSGQKQTVSHL